jgi:HK97 gp10 family phage protein
VIFVGIKLEGFDHLIRRIAEAGKALESGTEKKALKAGAEFLREKIEDSAPVRTGNLKRSIVVSDVKKGEINVGPNQQGDAFYGHMLEFGTSKMTAKPFMGPVFENNKIEVQAKMAEVIIEDLDL